MIGIQLAPLIREAHIWQTQEQAMMAAVAKNWTTRKDRNQPKGIKQEAGRKPSLKPSVRIQTKVKINEK
jgi:hypothetical protein